MNFQNYRALYGRFRSSLISTASPDVMVMHLRGQKWSPFYLSRAYRARRSCIDVQSPFTQALKTHFKVDGPASVFCKEERWTVFLGKSQVVLPHETGSLHLYITPYHVTNPHVVSQYLAGQARPPYDHVYYYKQTILFLDDQDTPSPGGCYFHPSVKSAYYRLCFLTDLEDISTLVEEWSKRRDVLYLPYLTQSVVVEPRFIPFQPQYDLPCSEAHALSTGLVRKKKSPHRILQDILSSYVQNTSHEENVGLLVEWPLEITYEGVKYTHPTERQCVALSVNGRFPERIVCVQRPYDRYMEYSQVPVTTWTPLSYVHTVVPEAPDVQKVVLDATVLGFRYKGAFFCASVPILEGRWSDTPLNTNCLLTPVEKIKDDQIQVIESFRHNDLYALYRVSLAKLPFDLWCLGPVEPTHPYSQAMRVPYLVKYWLNLWQENSRPWDVDVSFLRLTQMLAKHKICFKLQGHKEKTVYEVSSDSIQITMHPEMVEFINMYRLKGEKGEEGEKTGSQCTMQ